jgi:hypothetical protein
LKEQLKRVLSKLALLDKHRWRTQNGINAAKRNVCVVVQTNAIWRTGTSRTGHEMIIWNSSWRQAMFYIKRVQAGLQ